MTTLQDVPNGDGSVLPRSVELAPEPEVTPIRGSAQALVKHMQASLTVPTATTMRTFSVRGLDRVHARLEAGGRKISSSRLIAYALVRAAATRPGITHRFVPSERGGSRAVDGQVNLGIAVDVAREDGSRQVLVPVLVGADRHSVDGFVAAYDDIIDRARAGRLEPAQMQGANVILTNTGAFGSTTGVPRLPVGPGAIIAVGTISYPPGLEEVGEELGVSRICTVSSTYDHRVIQGADSGLFLKEFATALTDDESPVWSEVLAGLPAVPTSSASSAATRRPKLHAVDAVADGLDAEKYGAALLDAIQELHRLRREGYQYADLDPLENAPEPPRARPADWLGVTTAALGIPGRDRPFAEVFDDLVRAWCGTLSPDVWHLRETSERAWWASRVEGVVPGLRAEERVRILDRLTAIEALERFMQRSYTGHKTLSVEGLDVTVLIAQVLTDLAWEAGMGRLNIGMAHRGRVNVLAHIVGMPYDRLFAEFEQSTRENALVPAGLNGDVKQHLGWACTLGHEGRDPMTVAMLPNPSHLEFVSPVALGATRAHLDAATPSAPDPRAGLAVLMHGDAAFTGQGVVSETFNLHRTPGFTVGGAIHIVQDNQVGFTTERADLRSTRWPSDIARGYDIPVVHVNADDPEAALRAAQLAFEFRNEFGKDVVIHVVGYRRLGHTETDEPTFTQSRRYERIAAHPSVVARYRAVLEAGGVIDNEYVDRLRADLESRMQAAQRQAAACSVEPRDRLERVGRPGAPSADVADLRRFAAELLDVPAATTPHPKVTPGIDRRRPMLAHHQVDRPPPAQLANSPGARSGRRVRLTGQDVVRGTFTQRHATLHDVADGPDFSPLLEHPETGGRVRIWRSPLSETAVLGYEYGYSVGDPDALVLWEAQFGDFANGAQVITDQFVAGGHIKWGQSSRLTMLLPHGYDGAGPEHSSARVERFLQLAGEDNVIVAMPTTPAQYYSLLLEQATDPDPRPLVVFTPKSLLRHKAVVSRLDELAAPHFAPLLAGEVGDPGSVRTVLLCAGKVYYDLTEKVASENASHVAVVRVERLYPLPVREILDQVERFGNRQHVAWVQEEPRNMGAFAHVAQQLGRELPDLTYIGRPTRAATAEGYGSTHRRVQADLVTRAVELGAGP